MDVTEIWYVALFIYFQYKIFTMNTFLFFILYLHFILRSSAMRFWKLYCYVTAGQKDIVCICHHS